jgi:hypothetical protein
MSRKNKNSVKGKNSGRKFDKRGRYEPVDSEQVRYLINEDARVFGRVRP